jgi:divalent metal cation (Fe/Co/Zn/Cd) transporter
MSEAEISQSRPSAPHAAADDERARLVRTAFVLEWMTLAWVILEGGAGLWAGWQARSISLIAFGADSVIEALSACVLLWRLNVELRDGAAFSDKTERTASKISGALLFALAAYVVLSAAWGLWTRQGQEFSALGLAITVATIPAMYLLARRKLAIAETIGSPALRADAMESIACGWLSFVVVAGLLAQLALGAWWIDSVTSLAILYFLIKEGREAWAAEECGCSGGH